MLKGLSLTELAQRIEGLKTQKQDFIADTSSVEMKPAPTTGTSLVIPGQQPLAIRPTAHRQIATRLGIPAPYYDRMEKEQPALLCENVNTWLHKQPEKRMIRTLNQNVRAFLSNSYQRIENEEIAEVALPVLFDIKDVQIVSCEVTEKRMYIQAVSPRVQGEVSVGDVVQAGVVISNSEVGFGAVSVTPLVYRLRCKNGMILPDQRFSARHVGRKIEDNESLWADDTKKADDRAVLLKVRDMVRAAVGDIEFGKVVAKMQGLTEAKIEGNPVAAIEVLSQKLGTNESETGGILKSLIEGGDLSKWGILNAVTAQGHTASDYDRAVEFEKMGGQLLDLPATEWKQVLEADKVPVRRRRQPVALAA
jgi:hypothetical protein